MSQYGSWQQSGVSSPYGSIKQKSRRNKYGETEYQTSGGGWLGKYKFRYGRGPDGKWGYIRTPERTMEESFPFLFPPVGNSSVSDAPQVPENPGIRKEAYSTYGVTIPVSVGHRAVTGNIIDATDLTPRLIGAKTVVTEFKVPIYENNTGEGEIG